MSGPTITLRQHCDQRLVALRAERSSWWSHWSEIATYILPRRYRWLVAPNQARGSPINTRIIDETATLALRVLASGMMAGITSPSRPWFRLALPDLDLSDSSPVKLWLDVCQRRMARVMADSNFYTAKATQYPDLAAFGTAPMIIYEDATDVFRCHVPAAGEYCVFNDDAERPGGLYREFVRTAKQVVDQFGEGSVSPGVRASYERGGNAWTREVVVAHAIERNEVYAGVPNIFPWREVYWELGAEGDSVLRMRGFHEQPFSCPRWDLCGNDAYGRSPGMDALPAVKQLQQEQKRKAEIIDKGARPPMVGDVSMKNEPASLLPGGITYVTNLQGAGFKPAFEPHPQFVSFIMQDIQQVQERINRTFFADLFLMISQLETVRTATEIDARKEEKLIQLGPVLERFQNESLDVEIDRIFAIMVRRSMPAWARGMDGLLPLPPQELHGQALQIEYVSMLAEAQRAASTAAIERLFGLVGNAAALNPDILDNIDMDEAVDEYADMLGVSPKIIRATAKVVELRKGRAQQQQMAQAMQGGMAAAQGAKVLSETDTGAGMNALSMMMGGGPPQPANAA